MRKSESADALALAHGFWLSARQLPRMGPLIAALAGLSWGALWLITGSVETVSPLAALRSGFMSEQWLMLVSAPFILGVALLASFILTATSMRQLTRRDHLDGTRTLKALESEFLPMLRVVAYTLRRRLALALCIAGLYIVYGFTPVGGFALLFDLMRDGEPSLRFAAIGLALFSLVILHDLIPFVFTSYHVLFHDRPPAEAERVVREALKGHRERIFGGLLLASLPFYAIDECLFYIDWHPVLRRMIGAVFALPLLTCAYLYYERIETTIRHPGRD